MTGAYKLFVEAKQSTVNDKPEYCLVTGCILMVRKESCMYQACPKEGCNKKVVDQGNGMYRCEKCNDSHNTYKWRFMLNVSHHFRFFVFYRLPGCLTLIVICYILDC